MIVYSVERKQGRVIVKKGERAQLNAAEKTYVVYKDAATGEQKVSKLSDLTDEQLLLALANAIDIPNL